MSAAYVLLAQHADTGDGDSLAFSILALVGMIIPLIVLGVVIWIFWRAKRREDEERKRKSEWENEWENAPSS